jgi:hypothetical protein
VKIATMGSAPSSVTRAPFKNSKFLEFSEGKVEALARAHGEVPGDFEIWGCSPGLWAVTPRATRWFEVHRFEPGQAWFSPQYVQFLKDFKGPLYVGAKIPELPNALVYPIDRMEEQFASYFFTSSLALMLALAIDTIEQVRAARRTHAVTKKIVLDAGVPAQTFAVGETRLPPFVDPAELEKTDDDDIIGLWGVDMAAGEEWSYQRPGCQFFVLEAMRRGIAVYLPPESDLMRPMPVYGISEWDHNYIKLTQRAREINLKTQEAQRLITEQTNLMAVAQGEMNALSSFVNTWTSPYGMQHGMVIRQAPGTGLGSGITHYDGRPVTRMTLEDPKPVQVVNEQESEAIGKAREFGAQLARYSLPGEDPFTTLNRLVQERDAALLISTPPKGIILETVEQRLERKAKPAMKAKRRR